MFLCVDFVLKTQSKLYTILASVIYINISTDCTLILVLIICTELAATMFKIIVVASVVVFFAICRCSKGIPGVDILCSENSCCDSIDSIVNCLKVTNSSEISITFVSWFDLLQVLKLDDPIIAAKSITFLGQIRCSHGDENLKDSQGLYFKGIGSISLINMTIENCGVLQMVDKSSRHEYSSAVYFKDCLNITFHNVTIRNSRGSAVAMLNNRGNVDLSDSTFENNKLPRTLQDHISGGNGIFLLLNSVNGSSTSIRNCNFLENIASTADDFTNKDPVSRFSETGLRVGRGGGICIQIVGKSSGNYVSIEESIVSGNHAIFGGGMYVRFEGKPQGNTVHVNDTLFTENHSMVSGGGLHMGFVLLYDDTQNYDENYCRFYRSNFSSNSAKFYGGGVGLFSSRLTKFNTSTNFIAFESCTWMDNQALSGSAVDIAPGIEQTLVNGVFPRPLFINCRFMYNKIDTQVNIMEYFNHSMAGVGTILITGFTAQFKGETTLAENAGCGLYINAGIAEFLENSNTTFDSNIGMNGGAISLGTFAMILIHDNSLLRFVNNRAGLMGGAIYAHSNDPHGFFMSRNCFLQRVALNNNFSSTSGIKFVFEGNEALSGTGGDVFATSVQSCSCPNYHGNTMETFRCIGDVETSKKFDIATTARHFIFSNTSTELTDIVPGSRYFEIPIAAYDEYHVSRDVVYKVIKIKEQNLSTKYTFISENKIQFTGEVNASGVLKLETDFISLEFDIASMSRCSPGSHPDGFGSCQCEAERIFGLAYCENNIAYINHGFWMGFCSDGYNICTSHCPLGFCVYDGSGLGFHKLPYSFSELELFICGPHRTGVLCGSCSANNSAYYHSYMYACGNEDLCKYGILLYIISELLPLTVMFFIIILFDIQFTGGWVNGFILYAQVLDSISIDANGAINFPDSFQYVTSIHRFIYRMLNFDFFSLESLSFCLWPGATTLDVMVMKYVTIVYALCLLTLLIVFMNTWKCKRLFSCWRARTIQSSAKHGLAAFIMICYSQCARVSFQILLPGSLKGIDYTHSSQVAFRRGDHLLFSHYHLRYAIPAFFVLFVMSLIPIFLILYPLIFRVLALCKLNESKFASVISRIMPIPLLDLFQSSFKDDYRFFAGFYFLYRLVALVAYTYSSTLVIFYTSVELYFIVILMLHSIVQPYKVKWHNIIDSLIFANLSIVNGITFFNYFKVINSSSHTAKKDESIKTALSLQVVFIFLPLIYIICYFSVIFYRKCKARFTMNMPSDEGLINSLNLPPLRNEEESSTNSNKQSLLAGYTYGT